jgi:hypothetical protein
MCENNGFDCRLPIFEEPSKWYVSIGMWPFKYVYNDNAEQQSWKHWSTVRL